MTRGPDNLVRARVNTREARQQMPDHLVAALRDARARAGLTQRQAAEKLGISQQMVAAMEMGIRWPGVKTARRLTEVLQLPRRIARALLEHAQPNRRKRLWVRRGKRAGWRLIHEPEVMLNRTLARIDRASGRRGKGGRPKRRRFTRR